MIENNEQDKDNLFIVEFSWNLNDTYGESESDNNSDQKIQNEENIKGRGGRGGRNRASRGLRSGSRLGLESESRSKLWNNWTKCSTSTFISF